MCKLVKILSVYFIQASSSQNHPFVKLTQACCKLNYFQRVMIDFVDEGP